MPCESSIGCSWKKPRTYRVFSDLYFSKFAWSLLSRTFWSRETLPQLRQEFLGAHDCSSFRYIPSPLLVPNLCSPSRDGVGGNRNCNLYYELHTVWSHCAIWKIWSTRNLRSNLLARHYDLVWLEGILCVRLADYSYSVCRAMGLVLSCHRIGWARHRVLGSNDSHHAGCSVGNQHPECARCECHTDHSVYQWHCTMHSMLYVWP